MRNNYTTAEDQLRALLITLDGQNPTWDQLVNQAPILIAQLEEQEAYETLNEMKTGTCSFVIS